MPIEGYDIQKVTTQLHESFQQMRPKVKTLDKLAQDKGVEAINSLQDAMKIPMPHTVYKSYPESWLEQGNFKNMNRWLSQVSTYKVNGLDVNGCKTINDWLDLLEKNGHKVIHSSGTTGKPSFYPRSPLSLEDYRKTINNLPNFAPVKHDKPVPFIVFGFKTGHNIFIWLFDALDRKITNNREVPAEYAYGHFDPDGVRYRTRMQHKIAQDQATPAEIQQFQDMMKQMQAGIQQATMQFFKEKVVQYIGQEVSLASVPSVLYTLAVQANKMQEAGQLPQPLFDKKSSIWTGGGLKGAQLPEDWLDLVSRVFGPPKDRIANMYGMTESGVAVMHCGNQIAYENNFNGHVNPAVLPFLTDETGEEILPMEGVQEGRLGLIELAPGMATWPVIMTGDWVTINYNGCPSCEFKGPVIETIGRVKDQDNDNDKLSCAKVLDAYISEAFVPTIEN